MASVDEERSRVRAGNRRERGALNRSCERESEVSLFERWEGSQSLLFDLLRRRYSLLKESEERVLRADWRRNIES